MLKAMGIWKSEFEMEKCWSIVLKTSTKKGPNWNCSNFSGNILPGKLLKSTDETERERERTRIPRKKIKEKKVRS